MSEDRRKMYSKKGTGTVPKIKYAKNTIHSQEHDHNVVSNNLVRESNPSILARQGRNSESYSAAQFYSMEHTMDEANQNSISVSSSQSLHSNEVNSRRNSTDTIPKCDNVSKYPDKKQIEDKLHQIREYLHITSSLMLNMKNADEQSSEREELETTYNDLKDSEAKLIVLLRDVDDYDKTVVVEENNVETFENGGDNVPEASLRLPKNVLEKKVEQANHQIEMLKEQQNLLLSLKQKAESQLHDAKQAQQKLLTHQNANVLNYYPDEALSDIQSYESSDTALMNAGSKKYNHEMKESVDLWHSSRAEPTISVPSISGPSILGPSNQNLSDQLHAQVDALQQRVGQLRDSNDNRNEMIQFLDKRDAQLHNEHAELQSKLRELQNKKMQVDQLVSQLQNMNEDSEEDSDMGSQVRKIVCMKEHLSKLKDMLEMVKDTEISHESQNVNESDGELELINAVTPKSDNVIQNDVRTNRLGNHENITKTKREGNPGQSSNERRLKEKQVNKKTMNAQEKERLKLQAELQAKKRELEELMCKHKAASSNLNQDVHCENKSDIATSNNNFDSTPYPWYPQPTNIYHAPNSAEQYSSDEGPDDVNEYSEINSSGEASNAQMVPPMAPIRFDGRLDEYMKYKPQFSFFPPEDSNARSPSRTPDNHSTIHPISNTSGLPKERVRSNSERDSQNKSQAQKQLELIRSVCDSMLDQHLLNKPNQTTQNVRNNLTPSPLYSEPRHFASPNPHSMNALNVVNNPVPDTTWMPPNTTANNVPGFPVNDQNWLATNTLQTQAFMLNTLNQCCQMLWLQQREITALRNNVMMMQERLQLPYDQTNQIPSMYVNSNTCPYPPSVPSDSREPSQMRTVNPKMNHPSSATSLPNLNHPHAPSTNIDNAFATQNNLHNARILESGLNNTMHQNSAAGSHINNTLLQAVNQPLPSQIWNGQALNNQVAPGNRANNYWDNFRSYSRQNLLSTKSNEGLQNQTPHIDRLNNIAERAYSYPFTPQKQNPIFQDTTNSSAENTPRRRLHFKPVCPLSNMDPIASMPSNALHINDTHTLKTEDNPTLLAGFNTNSNTTFANTFTQGDSPFTQGDSPEVIEVPAPQRNRNERHDESESDQPNKSKLFEELRENVYKEVASLISANQGRPHFLIQLFRDLQLISSDPLRRQTLQSIQSLISDSLASSNNATGTIRQPGSLQNVGIENDVLANYPSYFEVPSAWNHIRSNIVCEGDLISDCPGYLSDVLTFLNMHSDEVLQQNLLESLRELIVESTFSSVFSSSSNPKDSIIQRHFTSLVTSAFEQYKDKRVQDVRLHILQTMEELLRGEISLIRLMRESMSDTNEFTSLLTSDQVSTTQNLTLGTQIDGPTSTIDVPLQMQNGDLAEADQSRLDVDDDEEGAVGGMLSDSNATQVSQDELDMSKIDLAVTAESDAEFSEQGLDQVPTRLTTHSLSKTNSSRDRSSSSRSDSEQF